MNLLDLCGSLVPTAFRADGLPSGLTLMAPAFQDQAVLEWAGRVHHTAKTGAGLDRGFDPESFTPSNGADSLIELFVCGAHMNGLSLNHQLTDLGSEFARTTRTAPAYPDVSPTLFGNLARTPWFGSMRGNDPTSQRRDLAHPL